MQKKNTTQRLLGLGILAATAATGAGAANAQTIISTVPISGPSMGISAFGEGQTPTYGQTFIAPAESTLNDFTFYLNIFDGQHTFQAHVYAWDFANTRITGSALFQSPVITTNSVVDGFEPITINTGGVSLTAGQRYVAFFSVLGHFDGLGDISNWGVESDVYSGGGMVYSNFGSSGVGGFSGLSSVAWTDISFALDLSFIMNFGLGGCPVDANANVCLIDSTTNQATPIDALAAIDTLQLGGATGFNFNVANIGSVYTNFETFEKIGAANVTLTGTAGTGANWNVLGGTLTLSGGNAIFNTSRVDVASGATLALSASETIGALSGVAGSTVALNANRLTTNTTGTTTTFAGAITGTGGLTTTGTGALTLSGTNTYTGVTAVEGGTLTLAGGAAIADTGTVSVSSGATLALNASETIDTLSGDANSSVTLGSNTLTTGANNGGAIFAGTISGSGGLVKTGTGQFDLNGTNTYTGTTTVQNGQLTLNGGSAIADTSAVVVNGGALGVFNSETVGSLAGSGGVVGTSNAAGATLTVGGDNTSTTYSGAIINGGFGAFGLTKIGTGNQTLGGVNTYTGLTSVNGGTLTLAGGNAIANTGAVTVATGATLALSASETIGSLGGAGILSLGSSTLTTGAAGNSVWTGTTSGTGALTKVGSGLFTTNGLGHTGLTTVAAGEMRTNGVIAGSVQINAGATLSGSATINGNLTNLGTLATGNSPGNTIVGGNYVGGGSLAVEVQLNNVGAPVNGVTHDFLQIGGSTTGTTVLNILPFAPSTAPAATTGNGVELVRVNGVTAANAFSLGAPVIQGGFEYLLKYVADYSGASDGFFLQSASIQELSLSTAILGVGRAAYAACRANNGVAWGQDGQTGRVWAESANGNLKSAVSNGIGFNADSECYGGGYDAISGANFHFGLSGFTGSTEATVNLPQGVARLDGDIMAINLHAAYIKDKAFMQAALGWVTTDWDIRKAGGGAALSATVEGVTGSISAGYKLVDGDTRITVLTALDFDDSNCGSGCLIAGSQEEVAKWTGSITAKIEGGLTEGVIKPFAAFTYSTDLDGGSTVYFGGAESRVNAASGLLRGDVGVEIKVAPNFALMASGSLIQGTDSSTEGNVGRIGGKLVW